MKYPVYIGGYSKNLFRGEFDDTEGTLEILDSIEITSPSYVCLEGDILYGVSETDKFEKNSGALFSVSVKADKQMNPISMQSTNGRHPCHLCVRDKYVFAANYSEGTLSIFERNEEGTVEPSHLSLIHYGKGYDPGRQEKAHIHFTAMSPDGRYLAVCDLGLDKVFLYPYSKENGLSTEAKIIKCPDGYGPRHLVFTKDGKTIYVLAELSSRILVYEFIDGKINLKQDISILPENFKGENTAAAIHISPDACFVAASNRGHDSVAICKIKENRTLEKPEYIMTGLVPRDFRYSPCGKWILSANQNDDTVTIYSTDKENKKTEKTSVPSPTCVTFGTNNI